MHASTPKLNIPAKKVFRPYLKESARHPWLLLVTFVGILAIQAADLIRPLYLKKLFDMLAGANPTPDIVQRLTAIVIVLATIGAGSWLARRMRAYSTIYFESRVMANLSASAFRRLLDHSHHFFISRFSGSLTRKVNKFSSAFETLADALFDQLLPTAIFAIGAVVVFYIRSHTLGIILGVFIIFFVSLQLYLARLRQPLRVARAEADSRVTGALSDAIANQNTISLFSGNSHEAGLFREVVGKWRRATLRSWNADEIIWAIQGFFIISINIGLLYVTLVLWQKGLATIGDFALVQFYLIRLFEALLEMNRTVRRCYDAYADASEMAEILEMPEDIKERPNAPVINVAHGGIAFKNVDFFFHNTRAVLAKLNLVVKPQEKLALVGPSGAGKTTITKLLLRLYDVTGGSIEIDGQNISAVTQESLRDAIAFVPQEPILFHRTLMDNIRYGRRDATDEEVIVAAKKAHCHEFITSLPEQYQTFVGERGVKLSGGERQRVAIARAILKDAPLLVLDEATSSLDSESEALIQDALRILMEGKTVIVIAHRLSTIMKMDRIVVIEHGKIVAEGSHQELVSRGGLYQKLWSIQAGGFMDGNMLVTSEE